MLTREMFNQPYLEIAPEEAEKQLRKCIHYINLFHPELEENFKRQFFVEHWKTRDTRYPTKTRIMWDFAPLSFYFEKLVLDNGEWKRDYNGGIIFHGSHDRGGDGGSPTFSVNLISVDGWATHT